jgi:uncharacterized protein
MIIHLFAEKLDSRAYVPVCRLIASDEEFEGWFDPMPEGTLPAVLINLFDGDLEPLKSAIESPGGGIHARSSALHALSYLTRARNVLSDDEMRAYLLALRKEMPPRQESPIWAEWAIAVGCLGYETLRAEVARLFSAGWINRDNLELEDFHGLLALSRKEPDGLAAFRDYNIVPFGSTIEAFAETWSEGEGGEGRTGFENQADEIEKPFVDPLRDVGRNDPCPCGSGKKYKKCCLAA